MNLELELKRVALERIRARHAREDRLNIVVALVAIGLLAAVAAAPVVVLAIEWCWGGL